MVKSIVRLITHALLRHRRNILTDMAIWSMCANSNGSEYNWNLAWATPCGDGGNGALPGQGCTLSLSASAVSSGIVESSKYSDSAIMYSLRFSLISSNISLLCFSTKAAVAALQMTKRYDYLSRASNYNEYFFCNIFNRFFFYFVTRIDEFFLPRTN